MNPISAALAVLSSPNGAKGGGAQIPGITGGSSSASGRIDSSNSTYNLSSGTPGDLIVGGGKNNTWMILGVAALVVLVILKKR